MLVHQFQENKKKWIQKKELKRNLEILIMNSKECYKIKEKGKS